VGKIASICGRYYAMDRDRRWDRTEKAYKAIVSGVGQNFISASDALTGAYSKNQTDEFVEPSVITQNGKPVASVDDNDAVIFYNFRNDRSKQLSMAFVLKDFENLKLFDFGYDPEASKEVGQVKMSGTFNREKIPKNIFFVSMTEYQKNLPVSAIAFGPEVIKESLGEIIARSGLAQAHISESEKERFVKYYFNGMKEEPMDKEDDIIVPSPKIATYDKKPEMSLPKLIKEFLRALNKDIYSFFLINFANSDMVGHTGNLPATIKAIEYVDKYLGILVDRVLGVNGTIFITADHGNAEELLTFPSTTFFFTSSSGSVNTDHSNNPVPFIAVNKKLRGIKKTFSEGGLSDVAPTILGFMGIEISPLMTGKNIFDQKNELNKPLPVQEEVKSN
jgi:2,3-bisphosphoglycerate-independent phosphoglycerate mutase